ncbi:hypothetical protein RS022_00770 [Candidatus Phytoplasma rubi]|uniref:Uncharacterized protein n=1 Tax=Candidatus Phytoplasma rubi TaxID=399025 RepID=A0ABY7BQP1_9MOLU|nr:hypothetical protein RS022_00770 [Candidatus Phytoplasma rubi]
MNNQQKINEKVKKSIDENQKELIKKITEANKT